jgi:hypothetical protein
VSQSSGRGTAVARSVEERKAPSERSTAELRSDIVKKRDDLRSTLDAIEFKLNIPKQTRHAAHRLKSRFDRLRAENPTAVAAGIGGAVVLLAGVAVLGYRAASTR